METQHENLRILLLSTPLPDANHVFDVVFEKSALAAIALLFALVGCGAAVFLWKQLKAERKDHREDCEKKDALLALKDAKLETINEQFRGEMGKTIGVTQSLITAIETGNKTLGELHDDLNDMDSRLRNGLRALGEKAGIPSHHMKLDD